MKRIDTMRQTNEQVMQQALCVFNLYLDWDGRDSSTLGTFDIAANLVRDELTAALAAQAGQSEPVQSVIASEVIAEQSVNINFDQALRGHENNCFMFEREVQTVEAFLRSREAFIKAAQPANHAWKTAVLDKWALTCMDAYQDQNPELILNAIICWHVQIANDNNSAQTGQSEPVAWVKQEDLNELKHCNYMFIGADSPAIWWPNSGDVPNPDQDLIPLYAHPAPVRQLLDDDDVAIAANDAFDAMWARHTPEFIDGLDKRMLAFDAYMAATKAGIHTVNNKETK